MIENQTGMEQNCAMARGHKICWSAVLAGTIAGLGMIFLLNLYAVAISLSVYSASKGAAVLVLGGLLAMLFGVIVSMAAAGFLAGYLGRHHYAPMHGGVIYGFLTWSLIVVVSALSAGPMAHYVSALTNTLSHTPLNHRVVVNDAANGADSSISVQNKNTATPSATVTSTELAWSGWVVFALFFVGALSSCIGACCGMHCHRCKSSASPSNEPYK